MKATAFRADMYNVLHRVLEEGKPAEVELSGRVVEIRPKPQAGCKLDRLVKRPPVSDLDPLESVWDVREWERNLEAFFPGGKPRAPRSRK